MWSRGLGFRGLGLEVCSFRVIGFRVITGGATGPLVVFGGYMSIR